MSLRQTIWLQMNDSAAPPQLVIWYMRQMFTISISSKGEEELYYLVLSLQTKNILPWLCLPQQISEGNYSNTTDRQSRVMPRQSAACVRVREDVSVREVRVHRYVLLCSILTFPPMNPTMSTNFLHRLSGPRLGLGLFWVALKCDCTFKICWI